ncbi:hypothetical protein ABPG72_003347 [Tetrahymena utriculariae]
MRQMTPQLNLICLLLLFKTYLKNLQNQLLCCQIQNLRVIQLGKNNKKQVMEQDQTSTQAQQVEEKKSFFQKIKHFIGMYLYFIQPQLSIFLSTALIGLAFKLRSKGIAGFLVISQIIQQFTNKSDIYLNVFNWLEPHKYFKGFRVHYESPLEQEKILLPFHPHSIYTMAIHFNMYRKDEELSKAYYCASRMALSVPLSGYFYRWQGLVGVNPQQFKQFMHEKKRICFVPGGFEEASLTSDRFYTLYLEHKGFIKYAMQTDYKIRPVFVFNENKAYPTIDRFYKLRLFLNKFKMGGVLFFSKYLLPFPNPDINIEIVVANPFEVKQIADPTKEEIEQEHKRYFDYVNEVYHKFKKIYDPEGQDLRTFKNGEFVTIPPPQPRL